MIKMESAGLMKLPTSPMIAGEHLNMSHHQQMATYMKYNQQATQNQDGGHSPPIMHLPDGQKREMTSPTPAHAHNPRSSTPNMAVDNIGSAEQFADQSKEFSGMDSGLGLGLGKDISPPARGSQRSRQNSKGSPNSDSDYGSNSTSGTPNKSEFCSVSLV